MAVNSNEYMREYYKAHKDTIRKQNNEAVRRYRQNHASELSLVKKQRVKTLLAEAEKRAEEYFGNDTT